MNLAEGCWKVLCGQTTGEIGYYRITTVGARLQAEYLHVGGYRPPMSGTLDINVNDQWTVPVERITEKEYFLARLKARL